MNKHTILKISWITVFSLAMGLLESSVVIYLRELYYPEGFDFPLKMMSPTIALTELLRESATLLMLVSIGILAGKTKTEKLGYFIYSFAIWDLFYYFFLKLLIHWPVSWQTWDVLFLLPTTWVGPVIAPVLLSVAMIAFGLAIFYFTERNKNTKLAGKEWMLLIVGSLIIILSFTLEYSRYMLQKFSLKELFVINENILSYAIQFIPSDFPWSIFWLGFASILLGIGLFTFRSMKS
ncbi:MAG: hypothetical protein WCX31_11640 [Salinivirgaceae bacterium]|jgi:hypothetical protein